MRQSSAWLLAAIAGVLLLSGLGYWQLGRARFKEATLAAYAQAERAQPVPLAQALGTGSLPLRAELPAEHANSAAALALPLPVAGTGRFDDDATVLLDNQLLNGRAGVMVYTLFRPDLGARALLVNRGWVALESERRVALVEPAGEEPVLLRGLLTSAPAIGYRMGNARYVAGQAPPLLTYLDTVVLAQELQADLFHGVLLLAPDAPGGFLRQWQEVAIGMPPARHRAYAAQWFALALALAIASWIVRRRAACAVATEP